MPSPTTSHPTAPPGAILISHGFQSNYERGFTNGLAANNCAITLIASDRTDFAGLDPRVCCRNLRGSQEENRPRWNKALNLVRYHLRLLAFALTHRQSNFHVIGLLTPFLLAGLLEGAWFRLFCRQYILTVHNLLPHDRETRINHWLYRLAYRLPHHLVVHTARMKEALVSDYGIASEKILIMEHGIEPWSQAPTFETPATPCEGPLRLLFFGKVAHYKGLDLLLSALNQSRLDFELTIAGTCSDPVLESQLQQQIASHRLAHGIHWQNQFVPEDQLPQLFLESDALVLPYRHIDQSGVLFQALRYGLPMVATDVGSFAHYISAAVGEICPANSIEALREALERMHHRHKLISRSSIAAIGHTYFWDRTTKAVIPLYA